MTSSGKNLKTSGLEHMPQLDGLRALAVLAVLSHHFLPKDNLKTWAFAGVKLFFVLSGFLITGILLRSRKISESPNQSKKKALRQFYMRRFLRIFPLYYFVIAIAVVINLEPVRQILPWLLTYTFNIYSIHLGWFVDHFAHFWTLAVEEQFYIFWPWIMLLTPRKWLVPVTLAFILTGPLYRAYEVFIGRNGLASYISTFACLDALCMGALLSILHANYSVETVKKILNRFALPAGLAIMLSFFFFSRSGIFGKWEAIFFDLALALIFSWLIHSAARGFRGIAGVLLESKPLTYLGRISYGIYVYHPLMPDLCRYLFQQVGWPYPSMAWLTVVLQFLATLAVSSLSWYLLEQPINNLKRYFKYEPHFVRKNEESVQSSARPSEWNHPEATEILK